MQVKEAEIRLKNEEKKISDSKNFSNIYIYLDS